MSDGPGGGRAWWAKTADGTRIRLGLWRPEGARGTVFLFPGRTEYIEKYGRAARDLAAHGLATFTIDWRGQGLADRLVDDAMAGHVMHFTDYQHDVRAMLAAAEELDLPRPWHLLGHSMGGCIGLRAAMEGMPVVSCVFSGPMWGIRIADALRPVAWSLSWTSKRLGMGHRYAPGTAGGNYVLTEPFETNKLTRDREMYNYMTRHLNTQPELGLGGPSLHWLHEALMETRALARKPSPDLPCLTIMGSDEDIVDIPRIRQRMAAWSDGRLEVIEGGRHEVMMDDPETRAAVFGMMGDFFTRLGAVAAHA
ncbi:hydrolase [Roseovarius sp. HI0049]|nr:hydrolase [Roseovarius sp. HI0049]